MNSKITRNLIFVTLLLTLQFFLVNVTEATTPASGYSVLPQYSATKYTSVSYAGNSNYVPSIPIIGNQVPIIVSASASNITTTSRLISISIYS